MGKRNLAIEYLRILFMALIVLLHLMQYGYGEAEIIASVYPESYIQLGLLIFGKLGVPGFIFITGYFGVRLDGKRLSSLLVQLSFYSLLSIVLCKLVLDEPLPMRSLIGSFLPMAGGWWFVEDYIILMLFSPFLNSGIKNISKRQFSFVVISLIVIIYGVFWLKARYSAMSLLLFFSIYLIGRYIALFPVRFLEKERWLILLISVFMLAVLPLTLHAIDKNVFILKFLLTYYNILTLTTILSLFLICNNCVRKGSGSILTRNVLAVYLVHCSSFGQKFLNNYIIDKSHFNFFFVLFIVVCVFVISVLLEEIRRRLCHSLEDKMGNWFDIIMNN